MKIVPVTERWNDGERDWSFVKDPTPDIEAWEASEGLRLPDSYRAFMRKYNGGRVHPRLFRTAAAWSGMLGPYSPEDDVTYVDVILRWARVESHWRGETYGRHAIPPGHLLFAETPGSIQLLMSLAPENHGEISCWIHSTDIWGTDRNTRVFPLASGFAEFLNGLFEDETRDDLEDWLTPLYRKLARDLEW